jgi:hypothetical protein
MRNSTFFFVYKSINNNIYGTNETTCIVMLSFFCCLHRNGPAAPIKIIIVLFTIVEPDDMDCNPPIYSGGETSSVDADPCGTRRARDVAL